MFLDLVLGVPILLLSASGLIDTIVEEDPGTKVLRPRSRISRSVFKWSVYLLGVALFILGVVFREHEEAAAMRYAGIVVASLISPAVTGVFGARFP